MAEVRLKKVEKQYPNGFKAVHGIDLDIKDGEFMVFVGPSGCAKSTTLRMIAGLETPNAGDIFIDGKRVNDIPASKRGIGFVFQSYALFRYMTVYDNVAFGLELQKVPKAEIKERVMKLLEITGLSGMEKRYPNQLSGGQRQRIGIARALYNEPEILILDEATSALDNETEKSITNTILNLKGQITIIAIAHRVSTLENCDFKVKFEDGIAEIIE